MYVAGKVNRAFTVNRIPTGRIGTAEKLNFQAIARGGLGCIFTNHLLGCFPGSPTRCAPFDSYLPDLTINYLGLQFRCTKMLFIASQAARPGKAASGGWGDDTGPGMLFTGGHHRNSQIFTDPCQILRKIRMF